MEGMDKTLYKAMAQHYYGLQSKIRMMRQQRDNLDAQIRFCEEEMQDLNDILCKHGNHIYEHFEEDENG